jgi:hypothetical protein
VWVSERIAWLVERDFGRHGSFEQATQSGKQWRAGGRRVPVPGPSSRPVRAAAALIAWVLGLGEHARLLDPQELVDGPPSGSTDRRAPRRPGGRLRGRAGGDATCATTSTRRQRHAPVERNGTRRHRSAPSASRLVALAGI